MKKVIVLNRQDRETDVLIKIVSKKEDYETVIPRNKETSISDDAYEVLMQSHEAPFVMTVRS